MISLLPFVIVCYQLIATVTIFFSLSTDNIMKIYCNKRLLKIRNFYIINNILFKWHKIYIKNYFINIFFKKLKCYKKSIYFYFILFMIFFLNLLHINTKQNQINCIVYVLKLYIMDVPIFFLYYNLIQYFFPNN